MVKQYQYQNQYQYRHQQLPCPDKNKTNKIKFKIKAKAKKSPIPNTLSTKSTNPNPLLRIHPPMISPNLLRPKGTYRHHQSAIKELWVMLSRPGSSRNHPHLS